MSHRQDGHAVLKIAKWQDNASVVILKLLSVLKAYLFISRRIYTFSCNVLVDLLSRKDGYQSLTM